MTSRERLMAVYRKEQPDKVPVRVWGVDPWTEPIHPSYQPLVDVALEKTDIVSSWSMAGGIFLSATGEVKVHTEERPSKHEGFEELVTTYETPEGPLTSIQLFNREGKPGYRKKYLIETKEDARRFLSIPYVPIREDVSSFFEKDRELGDRGIIVCGMGGHPMYNINSLTGSTIFAYWSLEERDLLANLMDAMYERCYDYLKYQLDQGVGPVFGYVGPELCIPPLQSIEDFGEFVVRYDKKLIKLVHDYGGYVWCHCHGKVGRLLEDFVDMGVDCLNPVEPPPMGDVTLTEAKARVGDKMCLEGNIEKGDLYSAEPGEIRGLVRRAIREGALGGGFILCPTSGYQEWPVCEDHVLRNYLEFMEAGLEFGNYPLSVY